MSPIIAFSVIVEDNATVAAAAAASTGAMAGIPTTRTLTFAADPYIDAAGLVTLPLPVRWRAVYRVRVRAQNEYGINPNGQWSHSVRVPEICCAPPKHTAGIDGQSCLCASGHIKDRDGECLACEVGKFQSLADQKECEQCGVFRTTEGTGSVSDGQCGCDEDYVDSTLYEKMGPSPISACVSCKANLSDKVVCPGVDTGSRMFSARGHWRSSNESVSVYPCTVHWWCVGANCT
jgi:hypothetical protein